MNRENEARQVQKSLNDAIDEVLSLPAEASMDIMASIGLNHLRVIAGDSILKQFIHSDETLIHYVDNILSQLEHLAHIVKQYEISQSDRIAFAEKVQRHHVN